MTILEIDEIDVYYDKFHVLRSVSMEIGNDEVVILVGQNGAGKTTVMKTIMGFETPRRGTIRLKGDDITGEPPYKVSRHGVTFVPGDRRIIPTMSVRKNLRLGYIGHKEDVSFDERLRSVFDYFPDLEEQADVRAANLSGGQQQMLAIGRALMSDPDLLLLDEPTEGLMPSYVEEIKTIIQRLNEDGISILLIEHELGFAFDVSDRTYILDRGQIQVEGQSDTIRSDNDILEQYLTI